MNVEKIIEKVSFKELIFLFKARTIYPYYHLVSDKEVDTIKHLYKFKNREQFKRDLDFLMKNYKPLNPKDLLNGKIEKNQFLISFDDGLIEVYTEIFPILEERNLKCIFFLNPTFVDNKDILFRHLMSHILSELLNENNQEKLKAIAEILNFEFKDVKDFSLKFMELKYKNRTKFDLVLNYLNFDKDLFLSQHQVYMNSNQINDMIAQGHYFGGHTMTHPPLGQLSYEEQKDEIVNSVLWVKKKFKLEYSFFAFPFSDLSMSKKLYNEIKSEIPDIIMFGNSGIKKDLNNKIFQRFSLEDPKKEPSRHIVKENLLFFYNILRRRSKIERR